MGTGKREARIENERIERERIINENRNWKKCDKCKGKGFHHGFGEHGHDPDWCTECGGLGDVIVDESELGITEERLKEIEQIYQLDKVESLDFSKYIRELVGACRYFIVEAKMTDQALENWLAISIQEQTLRSEAVKQADELAKSIESVIDQLPYLERILKIPKEGLVRNRFDNIKLTLREGVQKE